VVLFLMEIVWHFIDVNEWTTVKSNSGIIQSLPIQSHFITLTLLTYVNIKQ
jgi:hypothetical protein